MPVSASLSTVGAVIKTATMTAVADSECQSALDNWGNVDNPPNLLVRRSSTRRSSVLSEETLKRGSSSRDALQHTWPEPEEEVEEAAGADWEGGGRGKVGLTSGLGSREGAPKSSSSAAAVGREKGGGSQNEKNDLAVTVDIRGRRNRLIETPTAAARSGEVDLIGGYEKGAAVTIDAAADSTRAVGGSRRVKTAKLLEGLAFEGDWSSDVASAAKRTPATVMMVTTATSAPTATTTTPTAAIPRTTDNASLTTNGLPPPRPTCSSRSDSVSPTPVGTRLLFTVPEPDCLALAKRLLEALETLGCACRLCPEPTSIALVRLKACRPVVSKRVPVDAAGSAPTPAAFPSAASAVEGFSAKTKGADDVSHAPHGWITVESESAQLLQDEADPPIVGIVVSFVTAGAAGIWSEGDRTFGKGHGDVNDRGGVGGGSGGSGGSLLRSISSSSKATDVIVTLSTGRSDEFDLLVQELLASDRGRLIFSAPMERERRDQEERMRDKGDVEL